MQPPNSLCGKVEQLIPCVGKYKAGNQGRAWEITLNVKTCWGSQLGFGSLDLILEFLQPVAFSKASWDVLCAAPVLGSRCLQTEMRATGMNPRVKQESL